MPITQVNREDPWLTANEASAYLGLPLKSFYQHVKLGRVPCSRLGRRLRFKLSAIDAALLGQSGDGEQSKQNIH